MLQALSGVCDPTPKLETGVCQLYISKAAWEMAFFPVGAATGCTTQRPGRILGERSGRNKEVSGWCKIIVKAECSIKVLSGVCNLAKIMQFWKVSPPRSEHWLRHHYFYTAYKNPLICSVLCKGHWRKWHHAGVPVWIRWGKNVKLLRLSSGDWLGGDLLSLVP